jgi:hypothetical protein
VCIHLSLLYPSLSCSLSLSLSLQNNTAQDKLESVQLIGSVILD